MLKVEPRGQKLPFSDRALAQLSASETPGVPASNPGPTPLPPVATTPPASSGPVPLPPPTASVPATSAEPEKATGTESESVDWGWPVRGKVVAPFSEATKGMDIGGRKGAPIVAAAAAKVIYAGELRGYGKLVILKHNGTWVSAYAHNDKVLVKEGDDVRRGQKIAEMGSSDTDA